MHKFKNCQKLSDIIYVCSLRVLHHYQNDKPAGVLLRSSLSSKLFDFYRFAVWRSLTGQPVPARKHIVGKVPEKNCACKV